jgi:hypothetical protein
MSSGAATKLLPGLKPESNPKGSLFLSSSSARLFFCSSFSFYFYLSYAYGAHIEFDLIFLTASSLFCLAIDFLLLAVLGVIGPSG